MAYFTSVTGDIGIDKMGVCQPHEHVWGVNMFGAPTKCPELPGHQPSQVAEKLLPSHPGGAFIFWGRILKCMGTFSSIA